LTLRLLVRTEPRAAVLGGQPEAIRGEKAGFAVLAIENVIPLILIELDCLIEHRELEESKDIGELLAVGCYDASRVSLISFVVTLADWWSFGCEAEGGMTRIGLVVRKVA
jgi:hypothetical protein